MLLHQRGCWVLASAAVPLESSACAEVMGRTPAFLCHECRRVSAPLCWQSLAPSTPPCVGSPCPVPFEARSRPRRRRARELACSFYLWHLSHGAVLILRGSPASPAGVRGYGNETVHAERARATLS